MAKTYAIRPHLYYTPGLEGAPSPETAYAMIKAGKKVTVGSRDDVVKVMLMLGFTPDDLAVTVSYALHGAPETVGF
jgi:hypothetical protein